MLKIQHSDWFQCVESSLLPSCSLVSHVISLRYEFMADFAGFFASFPASRSKEFNAHPEHDTAEVSSLRPAMRNATQDSN